VPVTHCEYCTHFIRLVLGLGLERRIRDLGFELAFGLGLLLELRLVLVLVRLRYVSLSRD